MDLDIYWLLFQKERKGLPTPKLFDASIEII